MADLRSVVFMNASSGACIVLHATGEASFLPAPGIPLEPLRDGFTLHDAQRIFSAAIATDLTSTGASGRDGK